MGRKIRLLRADEIECRVSTVSDKGVSLLLYKDARVDQNILDETFGIYGWQRKHEMIGDSMFCSVSIRDEQGNWITKQDVGTETFAEPTKGAASDSFKRACFNIGIGRELYSAPFIWLSAEKVNIQRQKEKLVVKDKFYVSSITYDEDRSVITSIEIKNGNETLVYSYKMKEQKPSDTPKNDNKITAVQEKKLLREMERTGVSERTVCQRYQINHIKDMDKETFEKALNAFRKSKSIAA